MIFSNAASAVMAGAPPGAAPRRPPSRLQPGDQVPEPLGAADPGRMHERGQSQQLRAIGEPGRAQPGGVRPRQARPAIQRADQRIRQVPAARIDAAADQPAPGGPRRGQQPGVVTGKDRHRPRAGAAHGHDHAAGPARHVGAAHVAQVAADQPGAGAQADQPRRPHPPLAGGLGIGERQIPVDLRRAIRCLGPLPRQRKIRRIELRHHPAADEPQVRAQRPPRHAGQPRRAPGEPLGHGRVQQHLRHRLQPQPDAVVGELARRPQQVLRPLPPRRSRLGDHVPGERRRQRRHRRRLATARYRRQHPHLTYSTYT